MKYYCETCGQDRDDSQVSIDEHGATCDICGTVWVVERDNAEVTPNEELRALVEEWRDTHRTDNLRYAADELEAVIDDE